MGWERLAIDRFEADTAAAAVTVSQLQFRKPFGRVVINADQTTNLSGLALDSAAAPGEVVLLSPACASFDQFRDYEARGDAFRAAVEALA